MTEHCPPRLTATTPTDDRPPKRRQPASLTYPEVQTLYLTAARAETEHATAKAAAYLCHLGDGAKHSEAWQRATVDTARSERAAVQARAEVNALCTFIRLQELNTPQQNGGAS